MNRVVSIISKIGAFARKEIVFSIAFVLAVVSFFIVRPGAGVVDGIDFRTLVLLFSLMVVVAGLQRQAVFVRIGDMLISKIDNSRTLYLLLIFLCFFFSMVLTNDVALITFVPFSIMLLPRAGLKEKLPVIIVLQTLAANLGSVLTPLGNPQNLYLYNLSGMGIGEFVSFMLPMWCVSLILVAVPVFFFAKENIEKPKGRNYPNLDKRKQMMYLVLFVFSLLCVLKVIDYRILFVIVFAVVFIADRQTLARVDYVLLLTFVGFFVFIYDMKQMPAIVDWISGIVVGREFLVGVLASQVISNVPTALLLSGFTDKIKTLLLAVDVGGMGTLIASLASLISYKLYALSEDCKPGKYMLLFTAYNVIYLILICIFCIFVYHL